MNTATFVAQLDDIQTLFEEMEAKSFKVTDDIHTQFLAMCTAAVEDITLPNSRYRRDIYRIRIKRKDTINGATQELFGVIRALRMAVDRGHLRQLQGIAHAEAFASILDQADYLFLEGYKEAAAVLVSGVLESHLRQLCLAHGIPIAKGNKPRSGGELNDELPKKNAYSGIEHKNVLAWLAIRNPAAHGEHGKYTSENVRETLSGVRRFIEQFPA